jgi:hypothetical protein
LIKDRLFGRDGAHAMPVKDQDRTPLYPLQCWRIEELVDMHQYRLRPRNLRTDLMYNNFTVVRLRYLHSDETPSVSDPNLRLPSIKNTIFAVGRNPHLAQPDARRTNHGQR